jgi:hypothetical protein
MASTPAIRFSLRTALTAMTVAAVLLGMAIHSRGPMIVGLIFVSPLFFVAAMALIANRWPRLSKAILLLIVVAIALGVSLLVLPANLRGG